MIMNGIIFIKKDLNHMKIKQKKNWQKIEMKKMKN